MLKNFSMPMSAPNPASVTRVGNKKKFMKDFWVQKSYSDYINLKLLPREKKKRRPKPVMIKKADPSKTTSKRKYPTLHTLTNKTIFTHKLQCYFVCQHRGIPMCNIGKRSSMNKHWCSLEGGCRRERKKKSESAVLQICSMSGAKYCGI